MSPFFLPRITPLPPFAASRSGGGCCFDAVADAEEALEAQVRRRAQLVVRQCCRSTGIAGENSVCVTLSRASRSFVFRFFFPSMNIGEKMI